jgi:hypothetical protein
LAFSHLKTKEFWQMTLKSFLRKDGDHYLVGAQDKDKDYSGPVADVYRDKHWLFIVTDSYEGTAMLNIEALPALLMALNEISKNLKAGE